MTKTIERPRASEVLRTNEASSAAELHAELIAFRGAVADGQLESEDIIDGAKRFGLTAEDLDAAEKKIPANRELAKRIEAGLAAEAKLAEAWKAFEKQKAESEPIIEAEEIKIAEAHRAHRDLVAIVGDGQSARADKLGSVRDPVILQARAEIAAEANRLQNQRTDISREIDRLTAVLSQARQANQHDKQFGYRTGDTDQQIERISGPSGKLAELHQQLAANTEAVALNAARYAELEAKMLDPLVY